MLTIDDLRSSAIALDWHEAVAVAAALAGHVVGAPRTIGAPAPGDVLLLPSGDLRVSGPGVVGQSPAEGVAIVLARLLEAAPCPAELRQLVETYQDPEVAANDGAVGRFAASLAFFERPGREDVIASLAARAEPALERARRDSALEELTERTRQAALAGAGRAKPAPIVVPASAPPVPMVRPPADTAVAPPHEHPPDSVANRVLVPAIGLVVFLGMAYAAASYFSPTPPAAARGADAAPPEDDLPVTGPGLDHAARRPPLAASPSTVHKPGAPPTSPTAPAGANPGALSVGSSPQPEAAGTAVAEPSTATPVAPAPAPTGVDVAVAERDGRVLTPTPAVRPAPRLPVGRVFTNGDPKVIPAVLIRPRLPDQPPADVPEEQVGTLEFVVTETGAVEHVHLVSPANRYQERMIVAAAKTWQFQPATRDGHPVRFRTRIRVTL